MTGHFKKIMDNMRGLIKGESWSASSTYLLAVSGGMDSMCMADLFYKTFGPDCLVIAHCNFHLRGDESDGDEQLVRTWSAEKGIRCHTMHFNTEDYAASRHLSIEMAARELRYGWFNELCIQLGCRAVAVAHNANDNAETLLLNLLRGTGMTGLAGMSPVSDMPCPSSAAGLIRPLLGFTRKQIEGYVYANKIPYREDRTNALSDYKRNRIRNEVFPIFEKLNPSFVRTFNREMGYFAEAAEIVDDWCVHESEGIVDPEGRISLLRLKSSPHWKYLLYHILEPYGFNSATLASLEELLESDRTIPGKRFESPTHTLFTGRNELYIVSAKGTDSVVMRPADCCADTVMTVRGPGIYDFNGVRWKVEIIPWDPSLPLRQPVGVQILDASAISFPFVCRRWRKGDWLIPLGMRGKKKVSDLFVDLKYDALAKESALMIVDCKGYMAEEQHIAGVLGVRVDQSCKVSDNTEKVIRITILNN